MSASEPSADQLFLQRAGAFIDGLLNHLDTFDPDELEADAAGGVIKMAFAEGGKCVLNRQSAAHQIWLAEGASAWHFEFDEPSGKWIDTKGRGDLQAVLAEILTRRLGRAITIPG